MRLQSWSLRKRFLWVPLQSLHLRWINSIQSILCRVCCRADIWERARIRRSFWMMLRKQIDWLHDWWKNPWLLMKEGNMEGNWITSTVWKRFRGKKGFFVYETFNRASVDVEKLEAIQKKLVARTDANSWLAFRWDGNETVGKRPFSPTSHDWSTGNCTNRQWLAGWKFFYFRRVFGIII